MSHEIDAVNWDDTPFITLHLDDVSNLREHESDALDTILGKAGRARTKRGGEELNNALVIPTGDPLYATVRAMLENRQNRETANALSPKPPAKHWYLVSWVADRKRGSTEVPCALPLAAGDMMGVIAYLAKLNPEAGVISIVGVFPLAPKREEVKQEEPETAAPVERRVDVWIAGKLVRSNCTEDEAWDLVEKRHHTESYELLDSKTGKPV